jgi:hypothetical protein
MSTTPIFDKVVNDFAANGTYLYGLIGEAPVEEIDDRLTSAGMPMLLLDEEDGEEKEWLIPLDEEKASTELELVETPVETPVNLKTVNTLLDATHLETIKPAIPELNKRPKGYVKFKGFKDDEPMPKRGGMKPYLANFDEAQDFEATQPMPKVEEASTTVMERLKEADQELGLDELDAAFAEADRDLTERPTRVVTMPKKATPEDVRKMQEHLGNKFEVMLPEPKRQLPRRRNKRNKKPVNANTGNSNSSGTTDSPRSAA